MTARREAERLAAGKLRDTPGSQRPWRARLYAPSPRYREFRLVFKEKSGEQWVWTSRSAGTEAVARQLFAELERALDLSLAPPARQSEQRARTGHVLGQLYLSDSRARGKAARTVEARECRIRRHVDPVLGDLPLHRWTVAESRRVIAQAQDRGVRSAVRLADIRQDLAAMRKLAWREGWLSREIDPLDGLDLPRQQRLSGAGRGYVAPELRPSRRHLDAIAATADVLTGPDGLADVQRLPMMGTQIRVAGYAGLRLGEQLGLRAVDVSLDRGVVAINGSWTQPRVIDGAPFRGPVKNGLVHEAPITGTIARQLTSRCAQLLGLAADASALEVHEAVLDEQLRRGRMAGSPERWWELPVDPRDELWLFVDTQTGLPPRSELFNTRWHQVRRYLAAQDPESAWPRYITYRNLRHHAAGFWHDELGRSWADVAAWLGDRLATVLDHYVRSGVDALDEVSAAMRDL